MSDAPDPMTPADCDLRGYEYMPLMGHRLFGSTLYAEATDAEFRASIKLWWSAWNQCPAGSLPNSEAALAMLADYGRDLKGWGKVREMALRGFILCNDGRLYHPILCDAAVKAYALRLKADMKRKADSERLRLWRETKRQEEQKDDGNVGGNVGGNDISNADETRFTTPNETTDETTDETPDVASRREGKGREEEEKKKRRKKIPVRFALSFDPSQNRGPRKPMRGSPRSTPPFPESSNPTTGSERGGRCSLTALHRTKSWPGWSGTSSPTSRNSSRYQRLGSEQVRGKTSRCPDSNRSRCSTAFAAISASMPL